MKISKLSILMLIFISCNKNQVIDNYFNDFEKVLTQDEFLKIKAIEKDSLMKSIYSDFYSKIEEPLSFVKADSFISTLGINENQKYVLGIAFHSKINNQTIDFLEIKKTVDAVFQKMAIKDSIDQILFDEERAEIIKYNYTKFEIGDTLLLLYPYSILEEGGALKTAVYKGSYNERPWGDTLLVEGVLISKEDQKVFRVKTLFFNKENPVLFMKEFFERDTLHVDLDGYGRRIDYLNK